MSKDIIKYLPSYLQDVKQFKQICNVENIELDFIKEKTDSVLTETFPSTASEYGISRYEKIFDILNKTAKLYERRFIIESLFLNRPPFSMSWLKNKLFATVGNNYTIDMDYDNYKLVIRISYLFENALQLLKEDLKKSIPANIVCEIYLNENENLDLYAGGATISGCYEEVWEV